jgi:hypothetical protein
MKRWPLQTDPDDRGPAGRDRIRRSARPSVESLEARALLSTVHAHSMPKVPAAFKPPPNAKLKFPPYNITAEIDPISDPGGSGNVFRQLILVDGQATPFATVWLAQGFRPGYFTNISRADATGHYVFSLPVGNGSTVLQVFSENIAQDYSNVTDVTVNRGNPIVAWDALALRAFLNQGTSPAEAARDLAILHSAQYDAVAAVEFPGAAYRVHASAPRGTSAEAAADSSAFTVLEGLFPSLDQTFLNSYAAAVAGLPSNQATRDGLALGIRVANETLADRASDGSKMSFSFLPSDAPGLWRPTPPSFAAAVDPQFGQVTPFLLASGSEFRPAAPPTVGTAAYDQALAQVASLGRLDSTTRTADQAASARFWSNPLGTGNSPGPWNLIAEHQSLSHRDTLARDARLFAQLDLTLADAAIASADAKDTFDEWRPITAVRQADPTFVPLLTTPASPSYVSASAAYGAAAAEVLSSEFGAKVPFTENFGSASVPSRTFRSFAAAATEAASSRVWGGVSFAFDAQAGLTLGTQVARADLARFPKGK